MPNLKQKLPPLSSLIAFEAAARHLSFTEAGKELHVTQTAISRQIRALEEDLCIELFERGHRSLALTAPASKLLQAVGMGLQHIVAEVSEIRSNSQLGHLTVAATVAFATLWLQPKLTEFQKQHPDIDIRVLAVDRDVDIQAEAIDLAFCCGDDSQQAGVESVHLFDDELFPVCSPAYLEAHPQLSEPADLLSHTLLHLDEEHWHGLSWEAIDWAFWFRAKGVESPLKMRGMRSNSYPLLQQAAIDGQGIALGWRHLVGDNLENGSLICPLNCVLHSHRGHYLVKSSLKPLSRNTQIFYDWILRH
ncbi:LysR family transcriptional regulator [Pseudomaricurvus alkylphenolicus]|uniref:LysR substrate-binding domain-containing protein n=1 Tax=Pseudomaricurvus alkylphenolicus TaxID=1306991 RepID=UPI0014218BD0|nr:LysR substrate-binding domain-containing protein [Pseudomaricurvus alkylphenolicus]NIB42436.1 LysR family transcriptional regulator [Pseudomaricurvus alkylphenolicus]